MNGYMMEVSGKRYATNADNLMEAEEKLFEHLGNVHPDIKYKIYQVDSLDSLNSKDEITFF